MRLALVALLVSAPALAQRIGVVQFTGPNANAVRNQLVAAICDGPVDCVNTALLTTNNKQDWKKAKKEAVQFFVTGAIAKKGKAQVLTLEVLNKPSGPPKLKKTFPVERDGLSAKTLQAAVEALRVGLAGAPEPQPVETTPPVTRATEPPPPPRQTEPTPPPPPQRAEPEESTTPASKKERRIPFIAVELGLDVLLRDYGYVQPVTNLRAYQLPGFPMLMGKLELYPLALARQDVLGGLGVEASVGLAPWLRSRRRSMMDEVFPTSTVRFDAGLSWRIMPSQSLNLSLIPLVGVRLHSFTVAPSAAGERLDLLPNISYLGLRLGAGFELGLGNVFLLFGRFQVLPIFSSGEVISSAFFPNGSTFGLDGSLGFGVSIIKVLQVRAAFDFTQYALTFRSEPTDTFVAQGAVDRYLGGTVSVRFQY